MTGHIDEHGFFHSSSKSFQHEFGIAGLLFAFTEKYDFRDWHFPRPWLSLKSYLLDDFFQ